MSKRQMDSSTHPALPGRTAPKARRTRSPRPRRRQKKAPLTILKGRTNAQLVKFTAVRTPVARLVLPTWYRRMSMQRFNLLAVIVVAVLSWGTGAVQAMALRAAQQNDTSSRAPKGWR